MAKITEKDIVNFFLGTDDSEKKRQTEIWLSKNISSNGSGKILEELWKLNLGADGPEEEKEEALKNIYAKVQSERKNTIMRISLVAAASLLLIVSLGWITETWLGKREIGWKELYTEYRVKDSLTLSDGSRIWLNSGSRVTYPSEFSGKERRIFISGEAFIKVSPDKDRPFIVNAGPVTVSVLGTEFNIKTADDMSKVDVELYEGSVMMTAKDKVLYLSPGEKAVYDTCCDTIVKSEFETEGSAIWLDNGYRSGYKTLSEIASDFEKIYGVKLIIADESLGARKYQISLVPGMNLDDVLETLNFDGRMSIQKYDNLIILNTM